MGKSFVLDIKYKGCSEIFKLDYHIKWLDLEAMLKCYLNVDAVAICYMDDENDEVCLGCEAELIEAKKVAGKQDDVLSLKVICKTLETPTPKPTENSCSSTRPEPVETLDPEIETQLRKANSQLPIQCTSRVRSSTSSRQGGSYYADLVTTAGQVQRTKNLQQTAGTPPSMSPGKDGTPTPDLPAVAMTDDSKLTAAETVACETKAEAACSETAVPEELVERVVRGVLNGLDRAVVDAMFIKTPPKVRDQSDGSPAKNIFCHLGIICDNCSMTIVGVRYKCGHCTDYDLCESCEAIEGIHNPNHVFLKLRQPAHKGLGIKPDGRMVALLKRPIYSDDSSATIRNSLNHLEEKMARKAAKAELKRKFKEEKRRYHRGDVHHMISPSKRERLERMAESKVEEILQAAHVVGKPRADRATDGVPDVVTMPRGECSASGTEVKRGNGSVEMTNLYMRWQMDAEFVRDGNLPDDTHLQPGTKFVKSWVMKNTGSAAWNQDTKLKFLWGNMPASIPDAIGVPPIAPNAEDEIYLDFVAPSMPGQYQSHWRLAQDGEQFGHRVWCSITVDQPSALDEKKLEDATQEASSNAVAQLQADQQDPSILMRVCSSAEMLTAQDVLSFEMMKISDSNQGETETEVATLTPQTTPTPHNTPLGVTPCISPVRELDAIVLSHHMSQHSDLEIIEVPLEETEAQSGLDRDVGEMDGAEQEHDDDVETVSSSENSEDLLDDFEVVPLPDCFDPNKPLDTSVMERKSSVTGTQTLLSLMKPLPLTTKQDACVLAVTSCNSVSTDMPILPTTVHSECQTTASVWLDAASSTRPSSITVGTDVDALCPTFNCEAQTDCPTTDEESFVHVISSGWQTKNVAEYTSAVFRRDAAVTAVASSKCVATAGSFLNIASSVTQTESCMSQDAATTTVIPVSMAVSTSVDALINMAHTEAQTVPCIQRDAMTHAVPSSTAVATDVDVLLATAHSGAQTTRTTTVDAATVTAAPSSNTVATDVDALFNAMHAHSQTLPSPVKNAATSPSPFSAAVTADVDALFNTPIADLHTEPLIPHQAHSPLQILKIISPTVTVDTAVASASYQPNAAIVVSPFDEALDYNPPKIIDVTSQLGTNVDGTNATNLATGERDQEEFHDAVEPSAALDPSAKGAAAPSEPSQPSTDDQDPMEALGITAQKAMEYAGGIVKQAFGQAALSVSALLNPQPLPKPQDWPTSQREPTDPVDKLVEMGFGNRQRNKELLTKHNNCVSLCVQELLQEQDDSWHTARH